MFACNYKVRTLHIRRTLAAVPAALVLGLFALSGAAAAASPSPAAAVATAAETPGGAVLAQKAYRQGREAQETGRTDEARRAFTEAIRLDPTFPDPHYALALTHLPMQPGPAFSSLMEGLRTQWATFRGQHRLVLNLGLFLLAVLTGSLVATGSLIALKGLAHFQHPIREVVVRKMPGQAASIVAWILLLQPVLWGMGLYLTVALALGLLWGYLNGAEKKVSVAFVVLALVVPLAFHGLSRLTAPFNPDSIPYLLSAASESPGLPGLTDALSRATSATPTDPEPHLALGLVAERAGDLRKAEAEYRRCLELGGSPGRAGNNLGNVLFRTGRLDPAVESYQRAIKAEPKLAAPHYNLSQLYARRLQFDLVDQEMRLASQLDFEGMRATMAQNIAGGHELISLGAAPKELWQATLDSRTTVPLGVPRSLRWLYDGPLMMLPAFALLLFGVALVVGRRIQRFLPTYQCANCGSVVCRKCLRRIHRRAYCVNCGDTILSLKTSEFTRMLLEKKLHQEAWSRRAVRFFFMLVVPGWEAIRRGRPLVGLTVITIFMGITVPLLAGGFPVRAVPSLVDVPGLSRWLYFAGGLVLLYGLSALILQAVPEKESALMEGEIGMVPGSHADRLDRVA